MFSALYRLSCARINSPMGFGVCSKWLMKACGPVLRTSFPLKEESWQFPKQEDPSSFPLLSFLSPPSPFPLQLRPGLR